jgi:hypothetical protein
MFSNATEAGIGRLARDVIRPGERAAPSTESERVTDPPDLVVRALAILGENNSMSDETHSRSQPRGLPTVHRRTDQGLQESARGANIASEFAALSFDLPLQRRVLSDGTEVSLPIRYFDVQCLVATFLTELDRAAELLKSTGGLHAVPQEDGKAVVVLYCIEYRKTDIGPYNEVGLTIVAAAPGDPIPAAYVVNLPVTTAVANRAGREIWGYNKFVAAIAVNSDGKGFSTILRDADNEVIGALEGKRGPSAPAPPSDILTFTLLQGRLIKTLIQVLLPFHTSSGDGFVFKVGTSTHPMVNNLRALALDGARPVLVQYADPFQALLFPGRAV